MSAAVNYLERYFDCVDTMPRDLQRSVTRLREIELQHRRLLAEVDQLRLELDGAVARCDESALNVVVGKLQRCMLQVREVGNLKLEVSSQLLDTVEDYTQQLTLSAKQLDSPRCHEDHHHHSPRHSYTNSYHHNGKGESPLVLQSEGGGEKQPAKRNSSAAKRPRSQLEKPREQEDSPPAVAGRSRENSTTTNSSVGGIGSGSSGSKLPRKKIKTKKKSSKDSSALLPDPAHLPMPDLSSQPLDPNEPTYCLCNQVSFGEMIGCDNEECPIEWFHFQCVGLTSKPKGKWYCPQCTTERKTKGSK